MRDIEGFSNLVGKVYDCAVDETKWRLILEEICNEFGALCAEIQIYVPTTNNIRTVASYGWPEDTWPNRTKYGHLNPATPIVLVAPLGEPLWADREYSFEAFSKSLYYRLCLADLKHRDYIHVPMVRTTQQMAGWGVTRSIDQGTFTEEHVSIARLLSPHIRRALVISDLLAEHKTVERTLQGTLDALPCPALIVECDRRILNRNDAADAELGHGKLLAERQGRLNSPIAAVSKLMAAMAAAGTTRGLDVEVEEPPGTLRQVSWVRLPAGGSEDGPFMVLARKPAAELVTPIATAARLFNLTYAETQVLGTLLQGQSLEDASELLGVARSTVKTHLDLIFAKSGVRRQPDLVRRVMGLMAPVG